jgi:hypothetical protein
MLQPSRVCPRLRFGLVSDGASALPGEEGGGYVAFAGIEEDYDDQLSRSIVSRGDSSHEIGIMSQRDRFRRLEGSSRRDVG